MFHLNADVALGGMDEADSQCATTTLSSMTRWCVQHITLQVDSMSAHPSDVVYSPDLEPPSVLATVAYVPQHALDPRW